MAPHQNKEGLATEGVSQATEARTPPPPQQVNSPRSPGATTGRLSERKKVLGEGGQPTQIKQHPRKSEMEQTLLPNRRCGRASAACAQGQPIYGRDISGNEGRPTTADKATTMTT